MWTQRRYVRYKSLMKNIKYKLNLPIKPTNKPSGSDVTAVALAALDIAQHSLLSPAAVVSALQCAVDLYKTNIVAQGATPELVQQAAELGAQMAQAILDPAMAAVAKAESESALVDSTGARMTTGLVDASGAPLSVDP